MALLFGLKNCDTCRKALKSIEGLTFKDVRADGVPDDLLVQAHQEFGAALLNTRSTTWRGLSDDDRQGDPLTLLLEHPTLMKRPLIHVETRLFLGWNSQIEADVKAML